MTVAKTSVSGLLDASAAVVGQQQVSLWDAKTTSTAT